MGSTVSICNHSFLVLNIALSQICPLYYENSVQPGECMVRNVGKVWFRIEARPDMNVNRYTDKDVALPIIESIVATFTAAANVMFGGIMFPAIQMVGPLLSMIPKLEIFFHMTEALIFGNNKNITKGFPILWSDGWYFGHDRYLNIINGPKIEYNCTLDNGTITVCINTNATVISVHDVSLTKQTNGHNKHLNGPKIAAKMSVEGISLNKTEARNLTNIVNEVFNSISVNGSNHLTEKHVLDWHARNKFGYYNYLSLNVVPTQNATKYKFFTSEGEMKRLFKAIDKNNDQKLSLEEVLAFHA